MRNLLEVGDRYQFEPNTTAANVPVALLLIALFDVAPLHRACRPALPTLEVDWIGVPLSLLDNLRMPLHLDEQQWLDHTNATLPQGAVLYFPDASYYGDARHGVYQRAGLIRADIVTRYVASREWQLADRFWVQGLRRDPAFLQRFGDVTDHGLGLLEVHARR